MCLATTTFSYPALTISKFSDLPFLIFIKWFVSFPVLSFNAKHFCCFLRQVIRTSGGSCKYFSLNLHKTAVGYSTNWLTSSTKLSSNIAFAEIVSASDISPDYVIINRNGKDVLLCTNSSEKETDIDFSKVTEKYRHSAFCRFSRQRMSIDSPSSSTMGPVTRMPQLSRSLRQFGLTDGVEPVALAYFAALTP